MREVEETRPVISPIARLRAAGLGWSALFILYAISSTLIFLHLFPPFMGPDEPNHLKRAVQVAGGGLIGERIVLSGQLTSGGTVDSNIDAATRVFDPLKFHPERKVTDSEIQSASQIGWSGHQVQSEFDNTASYPPIFYLPESVGVRLGESAGRNIVDSEQIGRLANALACIAVGAVALFFAGRARPFLFSIFLLPTNLMLMSTVTQDGLLVMVCGLVTAIILKARSAEPATSRCLTALGLCLFLVAISKLPFICFAGLIWLIPSKNKLATTCSSVGVACLAGLWELFVLHSVQTPIRRAGIVTDPSAQISFLTRHPIQALLIPVKTSVHSLSTWGTQAVGVLGWLDTPMPKAYLGLTLLAAVLALAVSESGELRPKPAALVGVILLATSYLVLIGIYISYNPVGLPTIEGVQGRYFLPVLTILPLFWSPREQPRASWQGIGSKVVAAYPLLTLVLLWTTLSHRYH